MAKYNTKDDVIFKSVDYVYGKYKILRDDFYGNKPNLEMFKHGVEVSKAPICYNGDIFKVEDYNNFVEAFPNVDNIMIGRGILANPGLINEIKGRDIVTKEILKDFHTEVFNTYREVFQEDKNAMYRMKELWGYMIYMFSDNKKYFKKIKKAQKVEDYNHAVGSLFAEQDVIKGAGFSRNND